LSTPSPPPRLEAFARLLDLFSVPASLLDPDGRLVDSNELARQAIGYTAKELEGHTLGSKMPPRVGDTARAAFFAAVERAEPADFETAFFDRAGTLTPVRLRLTPLQDDGQVVGVLMLGYQPRGDAAELEGRPALTARQREILALLAAAWTTREIADALGLALETVRNHVRSVLRELHAHTRLEAVVRAERLGLLPARPLQRKH
jgi:PAS domain S-box-containing protein